MIVEKKVADMREYLARDRFHCVDKLDLGITTATIGAEKPLRLLFTLPYICRYYLFANPTGNRCPTVREICSLHALARDYTDRQNSLPKTWRITIQITATIIMLDASAEPDAIAYVQKTKERYQFGDANLIVLCSHTDQYVYSLTNVGMIGSIPICETMTHINDLLWDTLLWPRKTTKDHKSTRPRGSLLA